MRHLLFKSATSRHLVAASLVAIAVGLTLALSFRTQKVGGAAPLYQDIAGGGPLDHIYVAQDLACQVRHAGDTGLALYPDAVIPGDCGTLLVVNDALYTADFFSHDGTNTLFLGSYTIFTSVSQSGVAGSGTAADPYRIVTTVSAGGTGVTLVETDSYVTGDESYRTDIEVRNTGVAGQHILLYRAAECLVADQFLSYGAVSSGAPACSQNPDNTSSGRFERWTPITPGAHYIEAWYRNVWSAIALHTNLPDTCECAAFQPAGAGINWEAIVPAGGALTFSHLTEFAPAAPPTPTPTPTVTGTSTPAPTSTPSPTLTAAAATATPVPTNTPAPTSTPTSAPTATSTITATATSAATSTATSTAIATPTTTPTPANTATATPAPANTATATPAPTNTATATPAPTNTATATPAPTNTATATPAPTNTATRTPVPTSTATRTPTATPTATRTPTATFTATPTATPPVATPAPSVTCADVTGDGKVTIGDLVAVAQHMGRGRYDPRYDVNHDGRITVADLMVVLRQIGRSCP